MEAIDIPQAHVASERTRSTASYTPMTELDYGTLLCWGTNDQGTQLEPCVYHIVPAGESTICYKLQSRYFFFPPSFSRRNSFVYVPYMYMRTYLILVVQKS